jgi:hypothetical protein
LHDDLLAWIRLTGHDDSAHRLSLSESGRECIFRVDRMRLAFKLVVNRPRRFDDAPRPPP